MKNVFSLFLLLSFTLAFTACSPRVTTYKPGDTDLSKYTTFSFLPNADVDMPSFEDRDGEMVNERIVRMVNDEMRKQGYQLDRDNPELLVLIDVARDEETEVDRDVTYATYPYRTYGVNTVNPRYGNYYYNDYYNYNRVVNYDTDVYNYTDGTLRISLVDRATGNVVWRGITSEAIYDSNTTAEFVELVENVFEEYPLAGK